MVFSAIMKLSVKQVTKVDDKFLLSKLADKLRKGLRILCPLCCTWYGYPLLFVPLPQGGQRSGLENHSFRCKSVFAEGHYSDVLQL